MYIVLFSQRIKLLNFCKIVALRNPLANDFCTKNQCLPRTIFCYSSIHLFKLAGVSRDRGRSAVPENHRMDAFENYYSNDLFRTEGATYGYQFSVR